MWQPATPTNAQALFSFSSYPDYFVLSKFWNQPLFIACIRGFCTVGMVFIPWATRKKLQTRAQQQRRELRVSMMKTLVICLVLWIILLLAFVIGSQDHDATLGLGSHLNLRGRAWVSMTSQKFNEGGAASNAHHLIVVAGHSVTISGHLEDAGADENDWFLLEYQKGQGLPQAISGHIQAGIKEAYRDPDSLLIFSGGETRAITGPLTEGASYFQAADAMGLWPSSGTVRSRTTTEEFATDSFENLMFSICRFREVTGRYPTKITVVSFSFKQRRFETLHAPALGWPPERFVYIGVDPPTSTGFNLKRASDGERINAAAPFESDPYGCHSEVLQQKRKDRNPFHRTPPYALSCPDMKQLLSYCGPELFPENDLPWAHQ